ncbi:MAG TPA: flavin reductase, partial [Pseudomonas sp.]|nr:flavin reductase [Pseudomonas sp.]
RLCINILAGEQEQTARHFAGMTGVAMAERFDLDTWTTCSAGLPALEGALANLQGRLVEVQEVGTHSVLLVELDEIRVREEGDSLVYFSRAFRRVSRSCAA